MFVCLWFLFNAINHSSHTLITLERSNLPSAPLTLQERGNSSVMMPELLLLVGQGSERFFSSENKTKQKKTLVAMLNHSLTSLEQMIFATGMAFGSRAGSWGEERAICSSGKHGRTEIEV